MTQQPKVSVLISFYNLAPFVDQTMESVLAQKTDFPRGNPLRGRRLRRRHD